MYTVQNVNIKNVARFSLCKCKLLQNSQNRLDKMQTKSVGFGDEVEETDKKVNENM